MLAAARLSGRFGARAFSAQPAWVEGWLNAIVAAHPLPPNYRPKDAAAPTAAATYEKMVVAGAQSNRISLPALHYMLRACRTVDDIEVRYDGRWAPGCLRACRAHCC